MARRIEESSFQAIEEVVGQSPEGITAPEIADAPDPAYRLKALVDNRRLELEGSGRWVRYRLPGVVSQSVQMFAGTAGIGAGLSVTFPRSEAGEDIRTRVRQPLASREPVGYDRGFLGSYRPNESFLLFDDERAGLIEVGMPGMGEQPAGSYAKRLLNRLLIDLSWNSSRLEGNTYSLLDTTRLIEIGEEAQDKDRREAQMIPNHKDAIEILVENTRHMGFNRHTILNLHGALAANLLPDPGAPGRVRQIAVAVDGSVFHLLEVPHLIEECCDETLASTVRFAAQPMDYSGPWRWIEVHCGSISCSGLTM